MADLNTLNIQISASTTKADAAIDKLIGAFGRLNQALNNYSDSSDYVRGLSNLTSGLEGVSRAVSSIDVEHLKGVARAVSSLASAGGKLSNINISSGLQSLNGISITTEQFSGVKMLADSMGKLGGSNAVAAVDAIPRLAEAMRTLPTSVPAIAGIGELAVGLRSLGSGQVVHAADALPRIISSLQALGTITIPSPAGLIEVGNAVRAFGSAAAVHAAENLPGLAASLGSLMATLAAAPAVNQSVIDLVNALAQLSANGSRATSVINALTHRTRLFGSSARNVASHTKSLASTIGSLYAKFFLLIRAFRGIKKAIGYASDLTEVQNVVATTFGASTDKVQEFADTAIMSFGMSELSAKQFASRFQAMGSAMGVSSEQVKKASDYLVGVIPQTDRVKELYGDLGDSMADVSINLTKLTGDMASFYNLDYEDVAEDMQAVFTGMTRPLRKYGLDLTQATLKEWALANGLNADISKMSQAEKTMLRYQYVMSRMGHVMGDFNKTMNTWANVIRTIGQQFQKLGQIIGKGFISALKPILMKFRDFLNTFIDLAEKALNALGKLLGWQFEIEDVGTTLDDDMEDYNDSLDDAGDKAKELKKMLLGIDELNLLPDNSDDDGGGGGGGGGGGLSGGVSGGELHLVPYESDIESWFEFGRKIAKAEEAGRNFANFLNGLFDPEMFYEIGKAIANGLNTILHFLHEFAVEFDGTNFGLAIAAEINGFFENFDFKLLAATLNEWADKVWDAIKAALFGDENGEGGINWDAIWNGLKDFKDTIELDTIALIIGAVTIKKVLKWVFSGGITSALGKALGALIKKDGGIDLGTVKALGKLAWTLTWGTVAIIVAFDVGKKIGEALFPDDAEYYIDFDWSKLADAFKWAKDNQKLGDILKQMWDELVDKETMASFLVDTLLGPGFSQAKTHFMLMFDELMQRWNNDVVPGFVNGVQAVKDAFNSLKENAHLAVTNIRIGFSDLGTYLSTVWNGITTNLANWWNTKVLPLFTKEKWQEIGAHLKEGFETKWNEFKTWYDGTALAQWWTDVKAKFTKENWEETSKNLKDGFSTGWATFKNWWNNTAFAEFWRDIKEKKFSKDSWNLEGIWEGLKAAIEHGIQEIKDAWNNFKANFHFDINLPDISGYIDDIKRKWGELDLSGGGSGKKFASGGFPSTGSLFIANEAGPEMVGTIGNRTAVVNNGQIVESIKAGVYEAMASAMANGGSNVSVVLEGDTASFFSAIVRENNREIMRTGKSRLRN